jgi:uncharacterized SAM-binding protein YcdF (DUF218 family)
MTEQGAIAMTPQEQAEVRAVRWLSPFLYVVASAGEFMAMLLMTIFRYRNQGLEPNYFDLSKTANILGMSVEAPFILLFLLLAFLPRFHALRLAGMAAAMACISVVGLTVMPLLSAPDLTYAYIAYLAWKALQMGILTIVLRRPARSLWQKSLRVAIFAVSLMAGVAILVIASVLLSPISSTIIEEPRQEYDAAVILGAAVWSGNRPSPVLRERVKRGYDLLKSGAVQFVVLTGSVGAPSELPEAEVAKLELLKLGADPTRIVLETQTRSTVQQILFIRDRLMTQQKWTSFIIVSDQFHLKRALEICAFNDINASGVSSESPLGPQNLWNYHLRESVALILYWMFGV